MYSGLRLEGKGEQLHPHPGADTFLSSFDNIPINMKFSAIFAASALSTASAFSAVVRNPNFAKLAGGYLFPEIGRRRNAYLAENPDMADRIISLGIGDTTQPIPEHILSGLVGSASKLGTKEGYSGYGAEQGMGDLRAKIADKLYDGIIKADEVFVSDGAKCDISEF